MTVVGLARGGIPIAAEIARALGAPLDVLAVEKLGVPGRPELAMGAIASGGMRVLRHEVLAELSISAAVVDEVTERASIELERCEHATRGDAPPLDVEGRIVLVVDDGLATGFTMRAALRALGRMGAARLVVAVPVAARESCDELVEEADEIVCLRTPSPFFDVARWYEDFRQTTDEEVRALLDDARQERGETRHEAHPSA